MKVDEEWAVTCRDRAGKRRQVSVRVQQGDVVVTVPPGETAVLRPMEVGRLRAALRAAVMSGAGETSR